MNDHVHPHFKPILDELFNMPNRQIKDKATPKQRTFEDYLIDRHAEQYTGLDDEMPDDYEQWLSDLDVAELIKYANEWGLGVSNE